MTRQEYENNKIDERSLEEYVKDFLNLHSDTHKIQEMNLVVLDGKKIDGSMSKVAVSIILEHKNYVEGDDGTT